MCKISLNRIKQSAHQQEKDLLWAIFSRRVFVAKSRLPICYQSVNLPHSTISWSMSAFIIAKQTILYKGYQQKSCLTMEQIQKQNIYTRLQNCAETFFFKFLEVCKTRSPWWQRRWIISLLSSWLKTSHVAENLSRWSFDFLENKIVKPKDCFFPENDLSDEQMTYA